MAHDDADEFSVESVYADLLSRAPESKMEPRLDPLFRVMELLGDPQKAYPVIHLTGTNGKTSTARIIEAGLRALGLRTGRYTSPHLAKVTERISVDGEPVEDATFVRIWDQIHPVLEMVDAELADEGEPRLTYFECLTILGFAVFADEPVDVAVVEVGLGGITDATNIADGQVAVVTPISADHTDLLGETLTEIALEKSGIIKQGGFLVSAAQPVEAAQVLLERAQEVEAPFRFQGIEFGVDARVMGVGGQQLTISGLAGRYEDLLLPLHGIHQSQNAAVAVAALEAFVGGGKKALEEDVLREAFAEVTSPGRMEVVRTAPTTIIDAAHNPEGARATAGAVLESFSFSKLVIVLGALQEKDAEGIVTELKEALAELNPDFCFTQSSSPRAIPAEQLAEDAVGWGVPSDSVFVQPALDDAIEWAVARSEEYNDLAGGILITGSITVVGEARTLLLRKGSADG